MSNKKPQPKPAESETGTVRFHRVFAAKPEKVYRAFLNADAMAKWLPPYGFTCKVHHMDAKVGGTFRMSFENFTTAESHAFGGEYLELLPHQRIVYNDKFDDRLWSDKRYWQQSAAFWRDLAAAIKDHPAIDKSLVRTQGFNVFIVLFLRPRNERPPINDVIAQISGEINKIPGLLAYISPNPVLQT